MAHGTPHPSNAYYSVLQNRLDAAKLGNVFVYTVEGWPHLSDVIPQLKARGVKNVTLMPIMMVAGDHANNDMYGDEEDSWKSMIEKMGVKTVGHLQGIGRNAAVQAIYVQHAVAAEAGVQR